MLCGGPLIPAARSSRRSTARLRGFQRLEDRLCLSVTAVLEAGILSIEGSADDDRVELIADGAGNVTVRTDDPGAPSQVFQGVEGVSVDLLGGNDTFTFRGRGETLPSLIVRLGEGNDTARVEMTGALDVDLDIAAGEGDDDVGIGLLLPAVQKVREAAARMSVDLGDGADQFRLGAVGYPQVELDLTAGEGDDDVGIGLLLPAVQKVREAAARMSVDLGDGADQFRLHTAGVHQLELGLTAGGGDDDVGIALLLPAVQKVREAAARMSVDLGDGADQFRLGAVGYPQVELDLIAGEGDDDVGIGLLLPAVQKVRDAAARIDVDLGGGANSVRVRAIGYESVDLAFASWDGDDHVRF